MSSQRTTAVLLLKAESASFFSLLTSSLSLSLSPASLSVCSLFFESFHIDLCHVLRSLLTPDTGRAFLLAPTRGGSLDKFVRLVEAESSPTAATATPAAGETDRAQSSRTLHVASLARRYDDAIWQQHLAFLQATSATEGDRPSYAPDLHYPLLLTLAVTKGT